MISGIFLRVLLMSLTPSGTIKTQSGFSWVLQRSNLENFSEWSLILKIPKPITIYLISKDSLEVILMSLTQSGTFQTPSRCPSECSGRLTTSRTRSTLRGRSSSTRAATDLCHSLFCSQGNALRLLPKVLLLGSTPWPLKLSSKSANISTENRGFSALGFFQFIFLFDELGPSNQKILIAYPPSLLGVTETKLVSRQKFVRLNFKVDLFFTAKICYCDLFLSF